MRTETGTQMFKVGSTTTFLEKCTTSLYIKASFYNYTL